MAKSKAKEEKVNDESKAPPQKSQIPSRDDLVNKAVASISVPPKQRGVIPPDVMKNNMEVRRSLLEARLQCIARGRTDYPPETIRAWKRELVLMDRGLWRGPVKIKSRNKLVEEIIG